MTRAKSLAQVVRVLLSTRRDKECRIWDCLPVIPPFSPPESIILPRLQGSSTMHSYIPADSLRTLVRFPQPLKAKPTQLTTWANSPEIPLAGLMVGMQSCTHRDKQ